jgi:amino acid adenylation domain-containing protein
MNNTLVKLLNDRALSQPDDVAFIFLPDGDIQEERLTYFSLHNTACSIASYLQTMTKPGDRALLIFPSGLEFICAFFGCLYAGILAVPVQVPRAKRGFTSLQATIDNAQPSVILTDHTLSSMVTNNLPEHTVIITDRIDSSNNSGWKVPNIHTEDPAFLQYTSGSTGLPKGVMVTHGNLLHNQSIIKKAFNHNEKTIIVAWLPFYHDMGLIGNMLQPIYLGRTCIFMQPMAFLQNPFLWLQAISRYRGTTSGGPNFAYDLCIKKILPEQLQLLDLECWTTAFNGAEPVRSNVLDNFASYFAKTQFKKSAFLPCYGMAEATLFITGGGQSTRPQYVRVDKKSLENNLVVVDPKDKQTTISVVGCGESSSDQDVKIVCPKSFEQCAADQIGEIWASGPSIAAGYWNNFSATEKIFKAQIKNLSSRFYLRTGDLGFIFNNELFVVGRLKDLIIIHGHNYYPQDIEYQMEICHPSLKSNGNAAFSIDIMGEERLVVVQEIERSHIRKLDSKEVIAEIRKAISSHFDLKIHSILLLKTGQVPKTSSGKVKRNECRDKYLKHTFETIASRIETETVSETLNLQSINTLPMMELFFINFIAKKLKMDVVDIEASNSLSVLGIDSLLAVDLKNYLKISTGIDWPVVRFLQDETIQQLAANAMSELELRAEPSASHAKYSNKLEAPLSSSQQAMYFLYQFAPKSSAYNVFFAVTIKQRINENSWQLVWQHLMERHPMLRTTYRVRDGQTVQTVNKTMILPLIWESDASTLVQKINIEITLPFELDSEPPFRIRMFRINETETVFLFVAHHISCDLHSIILLMKECGTLYQQAISSSFLELPTPKMSYTDYVYSLATTEFKADEQKNKLYWENKLNGQLPTLNLLTDSPRQSAPTYEGSSLPFKINNATAAQLSLLSKNTSTTLYMIFVAIFQTLLHRYTHQDDLLIGSPVAGRLNPEVHSIVGCFINTVVLRAKFYKGLLFIDFLKQVRQTVLEALEHQEYPLHKIVENVHLQRDTATSPILQAMLIYQNESNLEGAASFILNEDNALLNLNGINIESYSVIKPTTINELTLLLIKTKEGFSGAFEYNTDSYNAETIHSFSENFTKIIEEVLQNPLQQINQLLVPNTDQEKNQLAKLSGSYINSTEIQQSFLDCYELSTQNNPDATAVKYDLQQLTYAELNLRANQLAHFLQSEGVKAETLVGVHLDRSLPMMIALLAILKAGGAYLPLDPSYPAERLDFMIDDSKVKLIISSKALLNNLRTSHLKIIDTDFYQDIIEKHKTTKPINNLLSSSLAYVLYTSGSTGKPKGVMIEHNSLNNFLQAMLKLIDLKTDDTMLAVTTISFDIAVLELFLPLMVGAKVVIANSQSSYNVDTLVEALNQNDINVMQATPATWQLLLASGWRCKNRFKALIGGDTLSPLVVEKLHAFGCLIWNLYGPTENTVWSAAYAVENILVNKFGKLKSIPIGKPINNVHAHILDSNLQLTPFGIPGELYLGGLGLARGYLNKPELTEKKFIINPISTNVEDRIYATGDLVRYLADGNIEFLGRIDNQVKLRGYRIELSEIESTLLKFESVIECAVILRQDISDNYNKILVGFVVAKKQISITELKQFLMKSLPSYMIPTNIEFLTALPRTQNNKIDRLALGKQSICAANEKDIHTPPQTPTEILVAKIWYELLNAREISINDNFFHLGGHSLLALMVSNKLIEKHSIHIPLQLIFERPTIASLAFEIDSRKKELQHQHSNIQSILDRVKNLSTDEVTQLLNKRSSSINANTIPASKE